MTAGIGVVGRDLDPEGIQPAGPAGTVSVSELSHPPGSSSAVLIASCAKVVPMVCVVLWRLRTPFG